MIFKRFGSLPSGSRKDRILKSPNYRDDSFKNIEPTEVNPNNVSVFKILNEIRKRPKTVRPSREVPNIKTNLNSILAEKPSIVWFGHSSYLLKWKDFTILVDPVFSGFASPFKFFGKAFPGSNNYGVEDMPPIDILLLTHDHYDHLDYPTIKKLNPKVAKIVTSLGVGSHLEKWGVEREKIEELDWFESLEINKIKITATPSRHFSGRGVARGKTLWSSFVLKWEHYNFYIGGDSGNSSQFRKIGEEFGPFDLAILECGQYGKYWPQIHMFPEQVAEAAAKLKTSYLMPVHWGKFVLSTHPWNNPIKRLIPAARNNAVPLIIPKIGELVTLGDDFENDNWYDFD